MSAAATTDVLYLVAGITGATESRSGGEAGATEQEVHALAYLACQLAQFPGPGMDWGYDFHVTRLAEPFAPAVSEALRMLRFAGLIEDLGTLLRGTEDGARLLERTLHHEMVQARVSYLETAVDVVRLLPIPLVLFALRVEPTIASGDSDRLLLDETARHQLSEYFDALAGLVGEGAPLLARAELWMRYLVKAGGVDAA